MIAFTRSGRSLLVSAPDTLFVAAVTDAATGEPGGADGGLLTEEARAIAVPGLRTFCAFDDEIWVVAGEAPPRLERLSLDGSARAAAITLASDGPGGTLVAASEGPRLATWSGPPAQALDGDGDDCEVSPLEVTASLIVPVSRRCFVALAGGALVRIDEGRIEALSVAGDWSGWTALSGAALLEGRQVALLVERDDRRMLIVARVADGCVLHRIPVDGDTTARFAGLRAHALLLGDGGRTMRMVDLRFGRVLRSVSLPAAVTDFAVDAGARWVALQIEGSDEAPATSIISYRDLFAADNASASRLGDRRARAPIESETAEALRLAGNGLAALSIGLGGGDAERVPDDDASDDDARSGSEERPIAVDLVARQGADQTVIADSAPPAPPPDRPAPPSLAPRAARASSLAALHPRAAARPPTRARALALLDEQRELVRAWAARAIAAGWDSGRIGHSAANTLPFAGEVSALLGAAHGLATGPLEEARARVAERERRRAANLAAARIERSPLLMLATEFDLTPLACDVLLAVAAPALWGELARAYAIVANDRDRALCDELLVGQLLAPDEGTRVAIARELDGGSPLVRHGLVRRGAGNRPFVALDVDPIIIRRLTGELLDRGDSDEFVEVRLADRRLEDLIVPDGLVAQLADRLEVEGDGPLRLVVRGRLGSGRRTLMAALAERANRPLGLVDAAAVLREPQAGIESLGRALRRMVLRGWLPCVTGLDTPGLDEALLAGARAVVAAHPGPLLLRAALDAHLPLAPGHLSVDLPPLGEHRRAATWRAALARHGLADGAADRLAAAYSVGPGIVERVSTQVAAARAHASTTEHAPDDQSLDADLEAALRQYRDSRISAVATRITRLASWQGLVLPPEILDSVREFVGRIRHRRTVYERWGFDHVMTTSRGLTALFSGGPGTGKSMVAGVIASELGYDLYRIDLSRVLSKWIGETERHLSQLFDAAEDGQAILLFDEADSLFARRTEVRTSVDRYANAEVNYLLQRLDTFEGIAILTTNAGHSIDAAFKRRLSFRLTFPFPDETAREQLWRVHVPPEVPTAGDFDFARLARTHQLSGGYIRNSVLRAAFLAAQEGLPLAQEHLERALRLEYREMGKLIEGGLLE